jgi:hypothetical protein
VARVRFQKGIVSAAWSYQRGQVVRVGASFTKDEIPAAAADAWLASGVVEHVAHAPTVPESAALSGAPERAVLPAAKPKPRRGGKA